MQNKNTENKIMKPASVTFKTTQKFKDLFEQMAKDEFRSLSMQVEKIVVEYMDKQGIEWREEDK